MYPLKGDPDCPYCEGKDFPTRLIRATNSITGKSCDQLATDYCSCFFNRNLQKQFPVTPYADPQDAQLVYKTLKKGDYVLYGDKGFLLYLCRCYLLHERMEYGIHHSFKALSGADIVRKYHMPSDEDLRVELLYKTPRLAVLFDSGTGYQSIPGVVQDVLHARASNRLPTWVYAASQAALAEAHEYSEGVKLWLKGAKHVLMNSFKAIKGYEPHTTQTLAADRNQRLNSNLGNI